MANKSDSMLATGTSDQLTPDDFENYVPWAVMQMEGDFEVIITRVVQAQYVSVIGSKENRKAKPKPKLKTESEQIVRSGILSPDVQSELSFIKLKNAVYIETSYNDANRLVAIKFNKNEKKIPRLVYKIINLVIPFHSALSSFTINQGLSAEGIHEISKYYATNRITELILDNCYVVEANYHILLDNDVLKHFSLSRCFITDSVVKNIASKLTSPAPAAKTLSALNLSINKITDIGVKYLAEMLRTNRQLSYLSLAHNTITDEGAASVLDVLKKFVLTKEECMDRSTRLISYLNKKSELMTQTVQELRTAESEKKLKRKSTRANTAKCKLEMESVPPLETTSCMYRDDAVYVDKAEAIVKGILGEFYDPFNKEETVSDEKAAYCLGNSTLRYLNLAYNNLTYISVRKINEVIKFQRGSKLGLLNIRIEGNLIPRSCNEYESIDDLLLTGLMRRKSTLIQSYKKKTVASINKK